MTKLHYTPKMIAEFIATLEQLVVVELAFRERQAATMAEVIERYVPLCRECGRPMIPRKLWYALEPQERPRWLTSIGDATDRLCIAHNGKSRYRPKPQSLISRLQAQVGFDPNRNYDEEERSA